jgi:hypothetical protein
MAVWRTPVCHCQPTTSTARHPRFRRGSAAADRSTLKTSPLRGMTGRFRVTMACMYAGDARHVALNALTQVMLAV